MSFDDMGSGRRFAVVLALIYSCGLGCRQTPHETTASDPVITLGTGGPAGVFHVMGTALIQAYTSQNIRVAELAGQEGGIQSMVDHLDRSDVDLAFADSESVYVAYRGGSPDFPQAHRNLRAIAVLFPTVVHVFSTARAGAVKLVDLRGKRIAVGQRGGYADRIFEILLGAYGLNYHDVIPIYGPIAPSPLLSGEVDGAVFFTPIWHSSIADVASTGKLKLLSLDRARIAQIQSASERNHFLKSTRVPRGTYPGQDEDVLTLGQDILLVCRADVPEAIVYNLTRILFESAAELARVHPAGRAIDVERGATAAIPLHPGALRYYRERDLPR